MSDEIIYLDVPRDAACHAARFGAQQSATHGCWFVVGPIHPELLNYLPRHKNQRFDESIPGCPLCGATMRKRISHNGNVFWGCARFTRTGCRGTIDYSAYLDMVAPVTTLGSFLPTLKNSLLLPELSCDLPAEVPASPTPDALREHWIEIVEKAVHALQDEQSVRRWLAQPKRSFDGHTPLQMMATRNGCLAVLDLLSEIWQ